MAIEVQGSQGWQELGEGVSVEEFGELRLRGLPIGAEVMVGPVQCRADESGSVHLNLFDHKQLRSNVGFLPIWVGNRRSGEIDVVPRNISAEEFQRLVVDLQRTWVDLVLDPTGTTSYAATGPDPRGIWQQIAPLIRQMRVHPPTTLGTSEGWGDPRSLRPSQCTPAVITKLASGQKCRTRVRAKCPDRKVLGFVHHLLLRLSWLAKRTGTTDVVELTSRFLNQPPFSDVASDLFRADVPYLLRHSPRFRPLLIADRKLNDPYIVITEGPGELRLGIKAIDRLYEYWVFLKVLERARETYGAPTSTGFDELATRLPGRRRRLDLRRGTTIEFPGEVLVAFEPEVTTNPEHSWGRLEYQPHPELQMQYLTPDIVVYSPNSRAAVVIDAKYRARHRVDAAAVEAHTKYARLRSGGQGVVSMVIAAHPNQGYGYKYAGYGAVSFRPGEQIGDLSLPPY